MHTIQGVFRSEQTNANHNISLQSTNQLISLMRQILPIITGISYMPT